MKRMASWMALVTMAILVTTSLNALPSNSTRLKAPIGDPTLDLDTVNIVRIHPQGTSIILRWHRQAEAIECFVVRAFQTDYADAETLFATTDTIWTDHNVLVTHSRAFYWIVPRFAQEQPHDTDQIEDFDGTVVLTSYPAQDAEPDSYRFPTGGTINPSGRVLELYGNTWKQEAIAPVHLHDNSVWRVAARFVQQGELQAIGIADSANEMWYTLSGTEQRNSEAWIQTYQGWYDDSVWVWIELRVGDDWRSHFGYDPNVNRLMFANDNDADNSDGVWQVDEILDVTNAISLPPTAGFSWEILSYLGDSMFVRFLPYNYDPEAPLAYVQWIFGDGTFSYANAPVHRYHRQRVYAATCVVADSAGQLDWAVQHVADSSYSGAREFSTLFTGDVMMGRRYESEGLIPNEGVDSIFGRMQPLISSVDFAACNLETPITDDTIHHPTKSIYFKSAPSTVGGLDFAGFDFCQLANNHNMDYMVGGMHDTKFLLDSVGILSTGAADYEELARAPVFFSMNGLCVAVLSFCNRDGTEDNEQPYLAAGPSRPGFAFWDRAAIEEMLPRVRDVADVVIVLSHSGIEYATIPPYLQNGRPLTDPEEPVLELLPDTSDVELRRYAIDMGADVVINTHPHVLQGCEIYNGKLIAHSLGNFAFDQTYVETFPTFALEARMSYLNGADNFVMHPVYIDRYIPTPASGELGQAILDYESELSRPMGTWVVRAPGAETASIRLDTNLTRTPHFYTDTLDMATMDTFSTSAPFKLRGNGYPVSVTSTTPGVEIRVGREITMVGNMEAEGSTLWNLNSTYEHYDSNVSYRGDRSIRLNRGGGGTNSVSTALLYRAPFNPGWNCSFMGWMQTDNVRDARMDLELWNSRGGGGQVGMWRIADVDGFLPWTWFWQDVQTPDDAWYYNIVLSMRAPVSGTGQTWFDDLMVVRWDDYQNSPVNVGFPNNRSHVQVRGPVGMTQAVVTYRRDTVQ